MSRRHGRALWLPDVLRDAGLPVEVVPGWEHRGKEPREWVAQCNHHTASPSGRPRPALGIVRDGRPDVAGPLANTLPDRDGVIVVVASGAANHPGVSYLPHRGGIASGVKYWCLGHEIELNGTGEPFPPGGRRYEAVSIMNAAIATYLGHDPSRDLWDHKSICRPPGRKIDVHPYNLVDGRIRCARRLIGTPTPTKDWFDMATEADLRKIVRDEVAAQLGAHGMVVVDQVDRADDAEHNDLLSVSRRAFAYARALGEKEDGALGSKKVRERAAEIDAALKKG